jgi:hypothetical protein
MPRARRVARATAFPFRCWFIRQKPPTPLKGPGAISDATVFHQRTTGLMLSQMQELVARMHNALGVVWPDRFETPTIRTRRVDCSRQLQLVNRPVLSGSLEVSDHPHIVHYQVLQFGFR